jgi:hypothetical protein
MYSEEKFDVLCDIKNFYKHGFLTEMTLKESLFECFYIIEEFHNLDELSLSELNDLENHIISFERIFKALFFENKNYI